MTILKSPQIETDQPGITSAQAGQAVVERGEVTIAAALAAADTVQLVKLPARHKPTDLILDCDDLDTDAAPAITLKVGLLDGTGDEFIASTTVGQAGGVARLDQAAGLRIEPSDVDRVVVVTVLVGPATGAVTGKIGATLNSVPA